MQTKTYYVIKHVPTGNYMPDPNTSSGRGGTHREPTPFDECEPRIFTTEKAAKCFIATWVQGKWSRIGGYNSILGEYYDDVDIEQVPGRRADDLAIIPCTLSIT